MSDSDISSAEARWRNYQKLIWTQQQIHLQIQQQQNQQQFQTPRMNGMDGGQVNPGNVNTNNNTNTTQTQAPPSHQGDMSEQATEESVAKDLSDPWENFDAQAAFLGPTLWDKRLPYDGQDFKLEYVDLEEFLSENGIPMESNGNGQTPSRRDESSVSSTSGSASDMMNSGNCMPQVSSSSTSQMMAGPSRLSSHHGLHGPMRPMGHHSMHSSRSPSPSGSASSGISHDMGSDTSPESSQNPAELALGSVPGHDFDPTTRQFTEDELKPQPMIKKSRKQFVPDDAKDNKYWARRRKNNMAAKRSRDARRVKENQIAMRACYLEKENTGLKHELERMQKENMVLKDQLRCCRRDH